MMCAPGSASRGLGPVEPLEALPAGHLGGHRGGDPIDLGPMRGFAIARVAEDHAVGVERMSHLAAKTCRTRRMFRRGLPVVELGEDVVELAKLVQAECFKLVPSKAPLGAQLSKRAVDRTDRTALRHHHALAPLVHHG